MSATMEAEAPRINKRAAELDRRREEIRQAIADLKSEVEKYFELPGRGGQPLSYWKANLKFTDSMVCAQLPPDMLRLVPLAADLAEKQVDAFRRVNYREGCIVKFHDERVLGAAESLVEDFTRNDRPPAKLESVYDLVHKQNVGPAQICRMYGWVNEAGDPLVDMVQAELDKEGTHKAWPPRKKPAEISSVRESMVRLLLAHTELLDMKAIDLDDVDDLGIDE